MKTLITIPFLMLLSTFTYGQSSPHDSIIKVNDTLAIPKKRGIGIEVKPVRVDFSLGRGQAAMQPIFVTNKFPYKVIFKARTSDWLRDSTGSHQYLEPGTLDRSCAQWVTFENNNIEVEPGKTKEILVKMKAPQNDSALDKMRWCLVFIETVTENMSLKPTDSSRTAMNTTFRVGIHILLNPPNHAANKQLEMLSFKSNPEEKNSYQILCENKGETQLECKGYLELSSLEDGTKTVVGPTMFPIFPEQRRYVNFKLPDTLKKGKYSILAVVDANEDDVPVQASEAEITIN